ncbi:MarR family transcriptional regulator [uncultured Fusobacterium sp.]|uniref:MarR family winged helix-turn-helix transcriptional regulator n=1 Tax=uncultured Fusobacterium sp. TaxID=159267 RepID=UPI0025D32EAB|nr:MarR family transcriptional regulator [uncultured Fusobacterium sp.]
MKRVDINNHIGLFVKKINNHIEREMYVQYKKYDIKEYSIMNIMIINYLLEMRNKGEKDIFQKDIEEEFYINKATASKMLLLMENKGLIARECLNDDRRLKKIILLPKGEELNKIGDQIISNLENKLQKNLTKNQLEDFREICKIILNNMK